eukprot:NODE_1138_length_992_cov_50.893642_g1093_i0.p1 GENE.NODE_1138_length_992_cov_50.893642_g1093_i0~~NODE_1138_length_992_cov_50.893642_g1093_i0.p1  ORF type:complete len:283 (+),score=39.52 NODE_1138_length_992_cov_50.893642_g1093_i0:80-928(+)
MGAEDQPIMQAEHRGPACEPGLYPAPPSGGVPPAQQMGGGGAVANNPMMGHLAGLQALYIRQKLDLIEAFCPACEIQNKYWSYLSPEDRDSRHNMQMSVEEESSCCIRYFCNPNHPLELHFKGSDGRTYLHGDSPMPFCSGCRRRLDLDDPTSGQKVGIVKEECTNLLGCLPTKISVFMGDQEENPSYTLKGPSPCWVGLCMSCPCRDPYVYEVQRGEQPIPANIQNTPNGCCKMCFTSADDYTLAFDASMNPAERALLMGAVYMLDYAYFQAKQQRNQGDN